LAAALTESELAIRRRLGVPDDARRVLVLAESSHWDPNWLLTSEQYFRWFVRGNLDAALRELGREPRRVYSIECVFFLRMYWERRPERREDLRRLVNEGRLRLSSSGVTTADTLIPGTETILRDLLYGQEWLRRHEMTQEPRVAYFPDSFGHSPALPSILRAAGFDMAAVTRVDGMYFPGADYEPKDRFPRPGSSAELLLKTHRSLDFVWRGPDGAEVLSHWNAFTYGQGDMLAHCGVVRIYNLVLGIPGKSEKAVAGKIERFASQLEPVSRTPYLFCPIGLDFNGPIPGLVSLLDRYNRGRFGETGTWAVNAGLDDYLGLVASHRERLPVIELDPNPYWTGFYTSRPSLKRRCFEIAGLLQLAEAAHLTPGAVAEPPDLDDAWWRAAASNHHDFVTGTAPDRVVRAEQMPWLDESAREAEAAIVRASVRPPAAARSAGHSAPPRRRDKGRTIEIETRHYVVEISADAGGCIVSAHHPETGAALLLGPSNDFVSYRDSGGLWRMGHEFAGGYLREDARASTRSARVEASSTEGATEVRSECELGGRRIIRVVRFSNGSPVIRFRIEGSAAPGRTTAVRFETGIVASRLEMDTPGGIVSRPPRRQYDPTFWPFQHSFRLDDDRLPAAGVALYAGMPGAASCTPDGRVELIAFRNAVHERAFGAFPLPGMPVSGRDDAVQVLSYAISFLPESDRVDRGNPLSARRACDDPRQDGGRTALCDLVSSLAATDRSDVAVMTVKRASRGRGLIVRLGTHTAAGQPVVLGLPGRRVETATLCDARERDLGLLEVHEGSVRFTMPGNIAAVRVITRP
jgi:hypothetical protein